MDLGGLRLVIVVRLGRSGELEDLVREKRDCGDGERDGNNRNQAVLEEVCQSHDWPWGDCGERQRRGRARGEAGQGQRDTGDEGEEPDCDWADIIYVGGWEHETREEARRQRQRAV